MYFIRHAKFPYFSLFPFLISLCPLPLVLIFCARISHNVCGDYFLLVESSHFSLFITVVQNSTVFIFSANFLWFETIFLSVFIFTLLIVSYTFYRIENRSSSPRKTPRKYFHKISVKWSIK